MPNKSRPDSYSIIARQIGQRIRWVRELVEPNRAEFARMVGVDRSTIRDIESGRRPPSIFMVLDLSHRLRIDPNYILEGKLRGVDGELAALLGSLHPEIHKDGPSGSNPGTGAESSTSDQPKKPFGRSARG